MVAEGQGGINPLFRNEFSQNFSRETLKSRTDVYGSYHIYVTQIHIRSCLGLPLGRPLSSCDRSKETACGCHGAVKTQCDRLLHND